MKDMMKSLFFFVLVLIILIGLVGCDKKREDDTINEKIVQELNYLDNKLIEVLNQLNSISLENYKVINKELKISQDSLEKQDANEQTGVNQKESSDDESKNKDSLTTMNLEEQTVLYNNSIDWKQIEFNIEEISKSWSIILIDLSSKNIQTNDLLSCSNILNEIIINNTNKDKINLVVNLAKVYSYIPAIEEQIGKEVQIRKTKSFVINAYAYVEQEKWDEAKNSVNSAEYEYNKIVDNIENYKNKESKINKTYVFLKELDNSLNFKEKNVFLIKYINFIQSINTF